MGRLEDKIVIITGASGGLGAAAAALFSREGAKLVLTGRDEGRLRAAAEGCAPDRTRHVVADQCDQASLARVVETAVREFGGVHVLWANAGMIGPVAPLMHLPLDQLDAVWQTNVRGTVALMQLVVPHMIAGGGGSILVTGSIVNERAKPGILPYVATKAALRGVIRSAALELARAKIRVNALEPGAIDNEMLDAGFRRIAPDNPDMLRQGLQSTIPLGYIASNEEVAKAALFLASDDSSYCTGSILVVDGGVSAA